SSRRRHTRFSRDWSSDVCSSDLKARLFALQGETDTAVIGIDDMRTSSICTDVTARRIAQVIPISVGKALSRGVYALNGVLYENLAAQGVKAGDLAGIKTLAGAHN